MKPIGDQEVASGEGAHERGLAGVGVSDDRHGRLRPAPAPPRRALLLDRLQLAAQLGDAVAYLAAIELHLRLASTLAADAAALAIAPAAALAQARCHVPQARDLHLQPRFARARVPLEDLQDHRSAVEHLGTGGALEVAGLRRRDVVVDQDDAGPLSVPFLLRSRSLLLDLAPAPAMRRNPGGNDPAAAGERRELLQLAFADDGRRCQRLALLRDLADHREPERLAETAQLDQRRRVLLVVDSRKVDSDDHRSRRRVLRHPRNMALRTPRCNARKFHDSMRDGYGGVGVGVGVLVGVAVPVRVRVRTGKYATEKLQVLETVFRPDAAARSLSTSTPVGGATVALKLKV
jgi:hypothetical protein